MMNWCLMSSDVIWHIRDKLWPMPKHGAINLYVHGNQKARRTDSPGRPPRLSHSSWTMIRSERPGQGLAMHLVWKQAYVQESPGQVSGRTQPARYQFPTFRFGFVLPQTSRIILCQTSPDLIEFWLTVPGFGQTDPVRKKTIVQESSGPLLANAS